MAIMENMTEAEVKKMEKHFQDQVMPENSEATFAPFKMQSYKVRELERLEDVVNDLSIQVSQLEHFIKTVFDGHVLIDGQFRKITP